MKSKQKKMLKEVNNIKHPLDDEYNDNNKVNLNIQLYIDKEKENKREEEKMSENENEEEEYLKEKIIIKIKKKKKTKKKKVLFLQKVVKKNQIFIILLQLVTLMIKILLKILK